MEFVHGASSEPAPGRARPPAGGRDVRRRAVPGARGPAADSFLRVAPSPCVSECKKSTARPRRSAPGQGLYPCTSGASGGRWALVLIGVAKGGRNKRCGIPPRRADANASKGDVARMRCAAPSGSISPSAQVMSIKVDERHITSRIFTGATVRDLSQDGYVKVFLQRRVLSSSSVEFAKNAKFQGKTTMSRDVDDSRSITREL
ncbi:hypothetical protein GLE_4893 [Lysobacter enzymogenes]|uniref:Uncharacterized protein n=1 Tax=Lysobacter enzymogenes TaxID=69 RepID=A0A0S2DNX5_LYSEN|nr:hypothetical protein GLE_4893 [Lysobacter enzymogenes]